MLARSITLFILSGLPGTATGFALGIFIYPYPFLSDIVAAERIEQPSAAGKLHARGTFIHASPSDPIHIWREQFSVLNSPATLRPL
jgi:hypothetical protein